MFIYVLPVAGHRWEYCFATSTAYFWQRHNEVKSKMSEVTEEGRPG